MIVSIKRVVNHVGCIRNIILTETTDQYATVVGILQLCFLQPARAKTECHLVSGLTSTHISCIHSARYKARDVLYMPSDIGSGNGGGHHGHVPPLEIILLYCAPPSVLVDVIISERTAHFTCQK